MQKQNGSIINRLAIQVYIYIYLTRVDRLLLEDLLGSGGRLLLPGGLGGGSGGPDDWSGAGAAAPCRWRPPRRRRQCRRGRAREERARRRGESLHGVSRGGEGRESASWCGWQWQASLAGRAATRTAPRQIRRYDATATRARRCVDRYLLLGCKSGIIRTGPF